MGTRGRQPFTLLFRFDNSTTSTTAQPAPPFIAMPKSKAALLLLCLAVTLLCEPGAAQQCWKADQQVNVSLDNGRPGVPETSRLQGGQSGGGGGAGACAARSLPNLAEVAPPLLLPMQVRSRADICSGSKGSIQPGDVVSWVGGEGRGRPWLTVAERPPQPCPLDSPAPAALGTDPHHRPGAAAGVLHLGGGHRRERQPGLRRGILQLGCSQPHQLPRRRDCAVQRALQERGGAVLDRQRVLPG